MNGEVQPLASADPDADASQFDNAGTTRREALHRLWSVVAACGTASLVPGCGGGSADGSPPPPPPPPPPSSLTRLQAALQKAPLTLTASPVTVTQGSAQSAQSSFGADAQVYPVLINPPQQSLATVPQVWGYRRDLWTVHSGSVIAQYAVLPVSRDHVAATLGTNGICGLHFLSAGSAFEILFAGASIQVTLIADGQYMAPELIQTTLSAGVVGAPLSAPNSFVRFDFGVSAPRQISVYARSTQGPCAVAVAANDQLQPWDRSGEASFGAIADSYGGAFAPNWGVSGPFWEAAALLGIPNIDLDAIGGTGYAPENVNDDTRNPGNAFPARLPSNVDANPDLFLTAGSINDDNSSADPPLYLTSADALSTFNAAVSGYYFALRAALPDSVLAAVGPWQPKQSIPANSAEQAKADTIKAALQAAGGLWVFMDNLNGGWINSSGASAPADGPWQTGTGNIAAPAGDGNGDLYVSADGVHPTPAGCLYLGTRIATDLRAAILAL